MSQDAWIVTAKWSNSSDTHHGPWEYAEQAERWAKANLDGDRACTAWGLGVLTPGHLTADGARFSSCGCPVEGT